MAETEDDSFAGRLTVFPHELDEIDTRLQTRVPEVLEFYWPNERALVDVTQTIPFLECEGLYAFWSADHNQNRIIRSFRKIGATDVADLLEESRWAKTLIENGDYDKRHEEFGAIRMEEFSRLDWDVLRAFKKVPPLALEFAKRKKVTGAPLSFPEKVIAWLTYPVRIAIPAFVSGVKESL